MALKKRRLFSFADLGTLMNTSTCSIYILTTFGIHFSKVIYNSAFTATFDQYCVYTLGIDSKTLALQVLCSTS